MRLHNLHMKAVGPFADEQAIDFDRLGAGGLFLFEGPTGVGKSTILDALTFALYGGLAGEAGDIARLRSDYADPHERPEVTVEFSVRGQRHRITRSPEYLRPKLRGGGTTREKSSVHLQRRHGDGWESISHAKDEVGVLVADLVGLNRDQFRQVVLLPQGEFATFLRADDDRRREVLAKLFDTQLFHRIAEQLQIRAARAREELQRADAELAGRTAAAWEAAGLGAEQVAAIEAGTADQRMAEIEALGARLVEEATAAATGAAAMEGAEQDARGTLAAAEQLVARVVRRQELLAALEQVEAERAVHEERLARLAAAERAEPVRALAELLDTRCAAHEAAVTAARESGADDHGLVGEGVQRLEDAARAALRDVDQLADVVELEASLTPAVEELNRDVALCDAQQVALETLQARARDLPAAMDDARSAMDRTTRLAAEAPAARERLERGREALAAATRLAELEDGLAELRALRRSARASQEEAGQLVELLTEQRLAGVRVELAGRLVSGSPCQVCGSLEHPAPARAGGAPVGDELLRDAQGRLDEARVHLTEVEVRVGRAEGERASLVSAVAGHDVGHWQQHVTQAEAGLAASREAEAAVAELAGRVAELAVQAEKTAALLLESTRSVAAGQARIAHRKAELVRLEELVEAGRSGHPTVAARSRELTDLAHRIAEQTVTVRAVAAARAEHEAVLQRCRQEAVAAGFADLAEARASILSRDRRSMLEAAAADWLHRRESATSQLDAPELAQTTDVLVDDARSALDEARLALEDATRAASDARRAATVSSRNAERFAARSLEVASAAQRRDELGGVGDQIVALDQYARGIAGSPRMTLVTYVLRHWFDQIVEAANLRLAAMSAGKYELLRTDTGVRSNARVGLGLAVLDRHTGRERSPNTLSGGETFYTSLALALGLADVVVAQAGGAELDTLFIDEGFGTLDADTLEDVMSVIDELRGNGRVIGIVSHVPDLKERIPERLAVRRVRPDGPSTVHVHA